MPLKACPNILLSEDNPTARLARKQNGRMTLARAKFIGELVE
jgi:hypothetical protein